MHLAEFNIGRLRYDWDDPRIADFADALETVYAIADRSPGFVWRLPEEDMDAAQRDPDGPLGGDPRIAATLSVWTDARSLERYVWGTLHGRFYDRRAAWFDPAHQGERLVLWLTPVGRRPTVADAVARLRLKEASGDTPDAFGWDYAKALAARDGGRAR